MPGMNKVFCIGMYKTGTTSIGKALDTLGLRTFHGGSRPMPMKIDIDTFNWSAEAFAPYRSEVRDFVELYDAFEDFPFMWIYRELHEDFPDAKFILTERDSQAVARSDINMWKQLGRPDIPTEQVFIDRYESHHEAVLSYFGDSRQLLRIQLGAGGEWTKLCEFLELPVPANKPFPRANVRPYGVLGRLIYRIGRPVKDIIRKFLA